MFLERDAHLFVYNYMKGHTTHLREKIGYGPGDMSSSMFWKIFSYYLPIFYSNVFGLEPAHAALLLLVTKLYDAVSDPVMGLIADRTHSRWGAVSSMAAMGYGSFRRSWNPLLLHS